MHTGWRHKLARGHVVRATKDTAPTCPGSAAMGESTGRHYDVVRVRRNA